jgi:hypothetical protein
MSPGPDRAYSALPARRLASIDVGSDGTESATIAAMYDTSTRPPAQRGNYGTTPMLAAVLAILLASLLGAAPGPPIKAGTDYGAGLTLAHVSDLETVLDDAEQHTQKPVLVSGRISDVCQKKGCWTVLSSGDANVRVRFKDYGFFLPKDCSGQQAYVEGVVVITTLSESDAKHYARESRDGDPDAIVGPQHERGFVATGVRLVERR